MNIEAGPGLGNPVWSHLRLWSLWDVITQVYVAQLMRLHAEVCAVIIEMAARQAKGLAHTALGSDEVVRHFAPINDLLPELRKDGAFPTFCGIASFHAQRAAPEAGAVFNVTSVLESFMAMASALGHDCTKSLWARAKPEFAVYFGNPAPWTWSVYNAFPSIREEIRDAGQALGVGLSNASVYHAMRIAEKGLRALAKHLRVTTGSHPIDHAQWDAILKALQLKMTTMKGPRSNKRQAALKLYGDLILEAQAFKDAYRNHASHSMVKYDDLKAHSVLNHVETFMQRMATTLHERGGKISDERDPLRYF